MYYVRVPGGNSWHTQRICIEIYKGKGRIKPTDRGGKIISDQQCKRPLPLVDLKDDGKGRYYWNL